MKFLISKAFVLTLLVFSPLMGASLAIYPGEQFITAGRASYYQASNSAEYPIAVVVEVTDWNITEEGLEDNHSTDEIVVFPSRFILKGKSLRKIRVSYRDKKPPTQEKTYRVIIREVPVSFNQEEPLSGVYMAIAYRTACYVKPIKSAPKLHLAEATRSQDLLKLTVENRGNAHQHIKDPLLKIKDGAGREQEIDEKVVGRVLTNKNLHAGSRRSFTLDLTGLGLTEGKSVILQCGEEGGRQKLTQLIKKGQVAQTTTVEGVVHVEESEMICESSSPVEPSEFGYEQLDADSSILSDDEVSPLSETSEPVPNEETLENDSSDGVHEVDLGDREESNSSEFGALSLLPNALFEDKWLIFIEPAKPLVTEDDSSYSDDADSSVR